jgi:hypothetical protein
MGKTTLSHGSFPPPSGWGGAAEREVHACAAGPGVASKAAAAAIAQALSGRTGGGGREGDDGVSERAMLTKIVTETGAPSSTVEHRVNRFVAISDIIIKRCVCMRDLFRGAIICNNHEISRNCADLRTKTCLKCNKARVVHYVDGIHQVLAH